MPKLKISGQFTACYNFTVVFTNSTFGAWKLHNYGVIRVHVYGTMLQLRKYEFNLWSIAKIKTVFKCKISLMTCNN